MPSDKIQTGIRFSPEMLAKITFIARKNCRSLNNQLEFITREYIEEYEENNGKINISEDEIYRGYC